MALHVLKAAMKNDKKPSAITAIVKSMVLTSSILMLALSTSHGFENETIREAMMYFFAFVVLLITFANFFISDMRYKQDLKQKQEDREQAQQLARQAQLHEENKQKRHEENLAIQTENLVIQTEILKEIRRGRGGGRHRR